MSEYFIEIVNGVKTFLTGMKMTLQHYNNKEELVATLQYPHEKWPIPERNIGFENSEYNLIRSRLHVDIDDCIGCLQCEKVCPVDCIKIDTIKPPKGTDVDFGITSLDTQKKMLVTRFSIDMAECMYCNLCAYPCPEECIYMVGGPNEHKHEIDYEFSQYKRDGLLYEFADPTEDQLAEVGGESYMEARQAQKQKLLDGENLEGIVEEEKKAVVLDETQESPKEEDSGLTLKVFNDVNHKPARGVAKKAFQAAKRANMDYVAMADYVNTAVNDAGKSSSEMTVAIEIIKNYKDVPTGNEPSVSESTASAAQDIEVDVSNATEFNVKSLNDIEDKMSRGIAKKAFTAAKREDLDVNGKINAIKMALNDSGKMTTEIETLLSTFAISDTDSVESDPQDTLEKEAGLFDIKLLNGIDDKMARGSAKKIYMAGKRGNKSTIDVIADIREELAKSEVINDDIDNLLNGIG